MLTLINAADVFTSLADMLRDGTVILAMVIAVIGIVISVLAGKIAKLAKKREIASNDSLKIGLKIVGLILILVALLIMAIPSIGMLFK